MPFAPHLEPQRHALLPLRRYPTGCRKIRAIRGRRLPGYANSYRTDRASPGFPSGHLRDRAQAGTQIRRPPANRPKMKAR
ncbi:hypothetical protein ACFPN7_02495 [Amycolatopsis halotolerans]|uniref:hypothetical protein n=1 Tax=Amycolatopsis halotolerans TaxID=330083 RepID=UPI0036092B0A